MHVYLVCSGLSYAVWNDAFGAVAQNTFGITRQGHNIRVVTGQCICTWGLNIYRFGVREKSRMKYMSFFFLIKRLDGMVALVIRITFVVGRCLSSADQ